MPRAARSCSGGYAYHVLNRGNARRSLPRARRLRRLPRPDGGGECSHAHVHPRLLPMPNQFHLALWPREDGEVSRWMHWLMTTQVRRYLGCYRSSGLVWQGRFKAFPDSGGRAPVDCLALHRAQSSASGAGRAGRSMAVVESALALGAGVSAGAAGAGHGARNDVGGGRQRRRRPTSNWPSIRDSVMRPAVRDIGMDRDDGRRPGAGV